MQNSNKYIFINKSKNKEIQVAPFFIVFPTSGLDIMKDKIIKIC